MNSNTQFIFYDKKYIEKNTSKPKDRRVRNNPIHVGTYWECLKTK